MHLNIERTDPGTCSSGTGAFYVCTSNGFRGCCTVDPCGLSTCPDTASTSVVTTVVVTAQLPSSSLVSGPATVTVFTERSALQSSSLPASTTATISPHGTSALTATQLLATSSATQSSAASSHSSSNLNHSALIAGVVVGIVVLAILSVLGWFCLRRHQKSRESRDTRKSYGHPSSSKEFVLERSISKETEILHKSQSDIFASYGGRYTSPQPVPAELAHHPEAQERIEEEEDRPLADMEKARVKTPPVHEHPAYARPGQSSYHTSMASHPAYHVSALNSHPAFRDVKVSHVPHNRSHQSMHTSYQTASPISGSVDGVVSPLISSPTMSSPIAGHMELEAEVPASYISPLLANNPNRYSMLQQNINSRNRTTAESSRRHISTYHHTTSPSTHSIPIGLGVGLVQASSSVPNLPLPSTFIPISSAAYRNSSTTPNQARAPTRPFIRTGPEIISNIQHPTPRNSPNSLHNQTQTQTSNVPILSRLEPIYQAPNHASISSSSYSSDEKEANLIIPNHNSQRWSDATIVTPASVPPPQTLYARATPMSLSVPDLIATARLGVSPNTSMSGSGNVSVNEEEGTTPTSMYTDGTATWGSWAAR